MTRYDMFIGGAWRRASGSAELDVIDSFTEQPFARYRLSSTADVSAAVESAKAALTGWSAMAPAGRAAFIAVKGIHFIQEDSPHEIGHAVADFARSVWDGTFAGD